MIYGLIIAAGNQTRFKSNIPKALVMYNGKRLLDRNIEIMEQFCDDVRVVVSTEMQDKFIGYKRIVIDSGKGCGDAVMKALLRLGIKPDDNVFIQWGDSLNKPFVYEKTLKQCKKRNVCMIPCVWEQRPYVQIKPNINGGAEVLFSKYGEPISEGWHDLSLFYGSATYILYFLTYYKNHTLASSKHFEEMQFLDIFNYTPAQVEIVPIDEYEAFSFNTIEEFYKLTGNSND